MNKRFLFLTVITSLFLFSGCELISSLTRPTEVTVTFRYLQEDGSYREESSVEGTANRAWNFYKNPETYVGEKIFVGWDDGSGKLYENGDSYALNNDVTFTTVYKDYVVFHCRNYRDDKSGRESFPVVKGKQIQLSKFTSFWGTENIFSSQISNWTMVTEDEVKQISSSEVFSADKDMVLVANWDDTVFNLFTTTFDGKIGKKNDYINLNNKSSSEEWSKTRTQYYIWNATVPCDDFYWEVYIYNKQYNQWAPVGTLDTEENYMGKTFNGGVTISQEDSVVMIPYNVAGVTKTFKYGIKISFAIGILETKLQEIYGSEPTECYMGHYLSELDKDNYVRIPNEDKTVTMPTFEQVMSSSSKENSKLPYIEVYTDYARDYETLIANYELTGWQTGPYYKEDLRVHSADYYEAYGEYPYCDETKKVYKAGETYSLSEFKEGSCFLYGIWTKKASVTE